MQILKSPNQMQTLKSLVGNNPQAMNLLKQLEGMSNEQQAQCLANEFNSRGISLEQVKGFLKF